MWLTAKRVYTLIFNLAHFLCSSLHFILKVYQNVYINLSWSEFLSCFLWNHTSAEIYHFPFHTIHCVSVKLKRTVKHSTLASHSLHATVSHANIMCCPHSLSCRRVREKGRVREDSKITLQLLWLYLTVQYTLFLSLPFVSII